MANSTQLPIVMQNLAALGLETRVSVQMQREVSAEEMRSNPVNIAHAKAWMWGVESDCENLMVFEDDAFFDGGSIAQGAAAVDKVVESGAQFDLLLLGYGIIMRPAGKHLATAATIHTSASQTAGRCCMPALSRGA